LNLRRPGENQAGFFFSLNHDDNGKKKNAFALDKNVI